MTAGVAAGHPATTEVGLRTLAAGGSAADAAVAAMLTCCVAETILAGLGGGGFATYYDAATSSVTCLDFFCAVPGVDDDARAEAMVPIEVSFGDVPMDYLIGGASVGVPGIPAGAGEVHRRWGRLPWRDVVAPAITLATSGVLLPVAQARTLVSVSPALLPGDGATIYAPGGRLLQGGDLLYHPGLDQALTILSEQGPAAFYTGDIGRSIAKVTREAGGCLGLADLAGYQVANVPVAHATMAGHVVSARADLSGTVATIAALPDRLTSMARGARAVALARALLSHGRGRLGDTTNISVVDADGNACVITLTLGIGSGVWVPGLGFNLNSMLGEVELITADLGPGQRIASNMVPLVVVDPHGTLALAAGSAGASRIRTALVGTLIGVLVDGLSATDAIALPRLHPVGGDVAADNPLATPPVVHVEPGYPVDEVNALAEAGFVINPWDHLSHYFGGVSAVGKAGAAGDPRRGGVGRMLP